MLCLATLIGRNLIAITFAKHSEARLTWPAYLVVYRGLITRYKRYGISADSGRSGYKKKTGHPARPHGAGIDETTHDGKRSS